MEFDSNLVGYDLQPFTGASNVESCAEQCSDTPGCIFWSWAIHWHTFNYMGRCYMKTSDAGRILGGPGQLISGKRNCIPLSSVKFESNHVSKFCLSLLFTNNIFFKIENCLEFNTFYGEGSVYVQTITAASVKACHESCLSNANCNHWVILGGAPQENQCHMFSSVKNRYYDRFSIVAGPKHCSPLQCKNSVFSYTVLLLAKYSGWDLIIGLFYYLTIFACCHAGL